MRRLNLAAAVACALLVVLSGGKASAQEAVERVQIKEGRISFVPPAGFKPLSKEEIALKYGRNGAAHAPELAYGNERRNVSVAVSFGGSGFQDEQLGDLKKFLEAQLELSIPGLEWLGREITMRDGRRWIHLRLKSAAIDTGVFNDIHATLYDGRMLIFNFNATLAQYEKYKESLRQSAQTITVK